MIDVKTAGFTVLAVVVVSMIAGVASAPATTLCKANETPCAEKNELKKTTIKASSVDTGFTGAVKTTCKKSTLTGLAVDTGKEGEVPLEFSTEALTFSECSTCAKVEALGLPWKGGTIEAGTEGNGILTLATKVGKIFFEKCGEKSCTASAESVALSFFGGSFPILKAVEEPLGTGTCGGVTWGGTYSITEPAPVWVVKG
jgi:hypothetical protein